MIENVSNEADLFDLLASRFCMAGLPEGVCSDPCVTDACYQFPRAGTNLLTVSQAEAVLRQVITKDMVAAILQEGSPSTQPPSSTLDISSEEYRVYTYGNGTTFKIINPVSLHVKENGSHRVLDGEGIVHRPTPGWVGLSWKPRPGSPLFVA